MSVQIVVELGVGELDELGQGRVREIAVLVVHRLDPRSINRKQLTAEQIKLSTQQDEFPEDQAERFGVGASKVGDGLEVRREAP